MLVVLRKRKKEKRIAIPETVYRELMSALDESENVAKRLKEYLETELTPGEVHIMNERLCEFELAGIEPKYARILADRDKCLKGEVKNKLVFCPVCGEILSTENFAEKVNFCCKCGQRVRG